MKDFKGGAKKSGAFGKKSSFAPRGGFTKDRRGAFGGRGGRDAEKPAMYKATCGDCGAPCEVPFRPNGAKPVLCSICFSASKGGERSFSERNSREFKRERVSRDFDRAERQLFKAVCEDCGAPCEVPFRPTAGKPVFCDACFHGSDSVHKPAKAKDDYREHLAALHAKLDHILSILKVNDAFVAQAEKIEKFEKKEIEPVIKKAKKLAEAKVKELEVGAKTLAKKAGKIEKEVKVKILKPAAAKIKKIKKKI